MVAIARNTLPHNYTRNRKIGFITAAIRDTLSPLEQMWIAEEWRNFRGGPEDEIFNVIMERTCPNGTVVWVMDRDGPDSEPIMMLPSDY